MLSATIKKINIYNQNKQSKTLLQGTKCAQLEKATVRRIPDCKHLSVVKESDGSRKEIIFTLVVLDLTLLYLQPEGRSVNRPCWGWVGSLRVETAVDFAVVDVLQRGQWSPGIFSTVFNTLCRRLQSTAEVLPYQAVIQQDAFNNVAVEVGENLWQHTKLPQPPQKMQPLLGPLYQRCGAE